MLEAYERLILDAMRGDHTLFTTAEGIERLWEVSIPLLENPPPVRLYAPGIMGAEVDPSARRPPRLAAALRTRLATPKHSGRLTSLAAALLTALYQGPTACLPLPAHARVDGIPPGIRPGPPPSAQDFSLLPRPLAPRYRLRKQRVRRHLVAQGTCLLGLSSMEEAPQPRDQERRRRFAKPGSRFEADRPS